MASMFTKICLPLRKMPDDSEFPDDTIIQEAFRALGLQLVRKFDADGEKETEITLVHTEPKGKSVPIGSTLYYRELSLQNAPKDSPESICRELTKYGIFFGAITHDEAFIYVTRVNKGELSVFIYQPNLAKCQKGSESLLRDLLELEIIDDASASSHPVTISSTRSGAQITHGTITNERVRHVASTHSVEIGIMFAALMAAAAFLAIDMLFAPISPEGGEVIDPLGALGRAITTTLWPTLFVAALTSAITLMIHYLRTPQKFISWDS